MPTMISVVISSPFVSWLRPRRPCGQFQCAVLSRALLLAQDRPFYRSRRVAAEVLSHPLRRLYLIFDLTVKLLFGLDGQV